MKEIQAMQCGKNTKEVMVSSRQCFKRHIILVFPNMSDTIFDIG